MYVIYGWYAPCNKEFIWNNLQVGSLDVDAFSHYETCPSVCFMVAPVSLDMCGLLSYQI